MKITLTIDRTKSPTAPGGTEVEWIDDRGEPHHGEIPPEYVLVRRDLGWILSLRDGSWAVAGSDDMLIEAIKYGPGRIQEAFELAEEHPLNATIMLPEGWGVWSEPGGKVRLTARGETVYYGDMSGVEDALFEHEG